MYSFSKLSLCVSIVIMCNVVNCLGQSTLTPQMKQLMLKDIMEEKVRTSFPDNNENNIAPLLRTTAGGLDKKITSVTITGVEEAETSIIVDPNDSNNLVLSFMNQSSSGLTFPIYYSSNKGTTWLKSSFNPQTVTAADFPGGQNAGGGDPVFAWDKVNNILYYGWIYLTLNPAHDTSYFTLNWAYSTDKGHTWQVKPGVDHFIGRGAVNPSNGMEYGYFDGICDREWFAMDNSGGPRQGTLYCSFINFQHGGEQVKIKGPSDVSFGSMNLAYGGSSQLANLEVDKSGILHMTFADISTNVLYHVSSSDGTGPYSGPHKIYQGSNLWGKANVVHDRENSAPSLATDGAGNLHVAWCDFVAGKVHAYYSKSTDGGAHWSTAKSLDGLSPVFTGKQMLMPTITAAASKVTITVTAIDPLTSGDSARVYQLSSSDNGQNFNPWPVLISSNPTYYPQYTPLSSYFFGDYNKSVSTACMTYAVWEDGRKGQGPKVYTATTNQCVLGVPQLSSVTSSLQLESVYPNPASDNVNLQLTDSKDEAITVFIYDLTGKAVAEQNFSLHSGDQHINLPIHLNSGMYVLSVVNDEGLVASRNLQVVK